MQTAQAAQAVLAAPVLAALPLPVLTLPVQMALTAQAAPALPAAIGELQPRPPQGLAPWEPDRELDPLGPAPARPEPFF